MKMSNIFNQTVKEYEKGDYRIFKVKEFRFKLFKRNFVIAFKWTSLPSRHEIIKSQIKFFKPLDAIDTSDIDLSDMYYIHEDPILGYKQVVNKFTGEIIEKVPSLQEFQRSLVLILKEKKRNKEDQRRWDEFAKQQKTKNKSSN
jgi:hypothetical protein